nr:ribonuclease H-like domain, reverse transcriptase, RNA-dependent DNA polymerase [Tanacetum cinerariifolium]
MNQLCDMKGITREFGVARTLQHNGIAERKNKTLIKVARTMLVASKLPNTFWSEAVNTACYVLNRALVIKPHNKTPYELIRKQTNGIAGTKDNIVAGQAEKKKEHEQEYIMISICTTNPLISQGPKDSAVDARKKATCVDESRVSKNGGHDDLVTRSDSPVSIAGPSFANTASPSPINTARTPACTNAFEEYSFERFYLFKNAFSLPHVPIVTQINDTGIFGNAYDDEAVEEEVDMNNVVSSCTIPDAHLTKFLKDNPKDQVIASIETLVQTRQMTKINKEHDFPDKFYKVEKALYGLHQAPRACQDKYVADILKKFDFSTLKTTSTLMEPNKALVKDVEAEDVDVHLYRSMIGSLMYLTTSRPDITFVVCACTRDLPFDLEAYSNSDYAGASLKRKSTTGEYVTAASYCGQGTGSGSGPRCQVTMLGVQKLKLDGNVKLISEASIRTHLKLEDSDGISTLPDTKIFEQLALMGYASNSDKLTFQKGHFSPQWRFLIHIILHCLSPKKTAWEQFSSNIATAIICMATNRTFNISKMIFEGMGKGSTVPVESHQTPSGDPTISQPRHASPSRVPTSPYDSPLPGGHTPKNDEGSLTLNELTVLCNTLSNKLGVISVAKILADATRVHTYNRRRREVSTGRDGVSTVSGIISTAEETISTTGVSMPVTSSPRATRDKGKAIMIESEPEQTTTKARVKADEELTQKLQAEEREKYSEDDRTKMLVDLINQRMKFFAQQRAEAKRNMPMTQAQQRIYMSNYIKHMGSYTLKQLKKLSFEEIKELFEVTMRWIQDFVPMEKEGDKEVSKLAGAGGSKRYTEEELDQESYKKQKTGEASRSIQEQPVEEEKELSQEDLQDDHSSRARNEC